MNTIVAVTPSKTVVNPGESFTVVVSIAPAVVVAGAQFNLAFNPEAIHVESVTEGNLFKQNGTQSFFMAGTIDNDTGLVKNVAGTILPDAAHPAPQGVSTAGNFAILNCTAKVAGKTSAFNLANVIVGSPEAIAVPLASFSIIQMQVASSWDLNLDGIIDMADLQMIVAVFGMTGAIGWRREDVAADGVINVLDLVSEAQHFLA